MQYVHFFGRDHLRAYFNRWRRRNFYLVCENQRRLLHSVSHGDGLPTALAVEPLSPIRVATEVVPALQRDFPEVEEGPEPHPFS